MRPKPLMPMRVVMIRGYPVGYLNQDYRSDIVKIRFSMVRTIGYVVRSRIGDFERNDHE